MCLKPGCGFPSHGLALLFGLKRVWKQGGVSTKVSDILYQSDDKSAASALLALTAHSPVDLWHLRKSRYRFIFGTTFHCWGASQTYRMSRSDAAETAHPLSSQQLQLWAHLHNAHQEAKRPCKWVIMFQPGACHHAPFLLCGGGEAINHGITRKLWWQYMYNDDSGFSLEFKWSLFGRCLKFCDSRAVI